MQAHFSDRHIDVSQHSILHCLDIRPSLLYDVHYTDSTIDIHSHDPHTSHWLEKYLIEKNMCFSSGKKTNQTHTGIIATFIYWSITTENLSMIIAYSLIFVEQLPLWTMNTCYNIFSTRVINYENNTKSDMSYGGKLFA